MKSEEITDVLTPEGIDRLKKGQVLMFRKDGNRIDLKITKLDKKNHRAWARAIVTFASDDFVVTNNKRNIWGRRKRRTIQEQIAEGKDEKNLG